MSDTKPAGRIAAVDFGTKRIGIAISDPARIIASPYENFDRGSVAHDVQRFMKLVSEEEITLFVIGLPLHMSGDESQKSKEARAFGKWLGEATGVPIEFFDERFSSQEADVVLDAAGATKKKRKLRRDMLAAQVILTNYLAANE